MDSMGSSVKRAEALIWGRRPFMVKARGLGFNQTKVAAELFNGLG